MYFGQVSIQKNVSPMLVALIFILKVILVDLCYPIWLG